LKAILIVLITLGFISCKETKTSENFSTNITKTPKFEDSFFAFKNLENTELLSFYGSKGSTFTFKGKQVKLTPIDLKTLKSWNNKLGFLDTSVYNFDPEFGTTFYYFSKQDPINNIQPIIIFGDGDLFAELISITFDKYNKPIDFYSLRDMNCAGMDEIGDSLALLCPQKNSYLTGNKIRTYINDIYFKLDKSDSSVSNKAKIDSILYETTILPNGKFKTAKVDSFRVYRFYR
jgi:hypothetical protein